MITSAVGTSAIMRLRLMAIWRERMAPFSAAGRLGVLVLVADFLLWSS
jgi:hypothetical protein